MQKTRFFTRRKKNIRFSASRTFFFTFFSKKTRFSSSQSDVCPLHGVSTPQKDETEGRMQLAILTFTRIWFSRPKVQLFGPNFSAFSGFFEKNAFFAHRTPIICTFHHFYPVNVQKKRVFSCFFPFFMVIFFITFGFPLRFSSLKKRVFPSLSHVSIFFLTNPRGESIFFIFFAVFSQEPLFVLLKGVFQARPAVKNSRKNAFFRLFLTFLTFRISNTPSCEKRLPP